MPDGAPFDDMLCGSCRYALRGLSVVDGAVTCPECAAVVAMPLGKPGLGWIRSFAAWSCLTVLICGSHLIAMGFDPGMDRYGLMTRDVYVWALITAPVAPVVLAYWSAGDAVDPEAQQRLFWRSLVRGTFVNVMLVFASALVQPPGPFAIAC